MKLLVAARQSPEFGVRLLAELPPAARAEAVRRWTLAEPAAPPGRPGLRKCAPPRPSELDAQLRAYSRTIGRVG